MLGKTINESSIQYRQTVMPGHTNALGTLFGGTMMGWVDEACAMAAQKHARKMVVTIHMDDISFTEPVLLGDQVVIHAHITYAGRTSMEVRAWVFRENPPLDIYQPCLTALLSFVAIDPQRKPTSIPPLVPQNDQERQLIAAAQKRMQERRLKAHFR